MQKSIERNCSPTETTFVVWVGPARPRHLCRRQGKDEGILAIAFDWFFFPVEVSVNAKGIKKNGVYESITLTAQNRRDSLFLAYLKRTINKEGFMRVECLPVIQNPRAFMLKAGVVREIYTLTNGKAFEDIKRFFDQPLRVRILYPRNSPYEMLCLMSCSQNTQFCLERIFFWFCSKVIRQKKETIFGH